jgi:hypothetical protein
MSNSTQSLPSSGPIRVEHKVITDTDPATGTVTHEVWYKDDKPDRADGPAAIERNAATEAGYKDGQKFEPSAEVRVAWLKKSGERIAPSPPAAKSAPAPG